jgi:outer membrane lipoprotein-sorting protein
MKNILRLGLIATAALVLFNAVAVTETKAQVLNDILKRMDTHYKALSSLKANIAREKYNSQLKETDKQQGTISLIPGKGKKGSKVAFRLDWTKPTTEIISVVNGKYVAFKESTKIVYTGSTGSKKLNEKGGNVMQIFSMSKDEIKATYDVYYVGKEDIPGGISTWHLKLVPKTKMSYKFSELWVDGNGMPLMARITMENNDTDTVLISGLKKNEKIDSNIFKVNFPPGTKIEKL